MPGDIKVTLLEEGDVVLADDSWRIENISHDRREVMISQNIKDIAGPESTMNVEGEIQHLSMYAIDMDGPPVNEFGGLMVEGTVASVSGGVDTGDDSRVKLPYTYIAENEGISVRGKRFLVTSVEKLDDKSGHCVGDRNIILMEMTDAGNIKRDGLVASFEQTGNFVRGSYRVWNADVTCKTPLVKKDGRLFTKGRQIYPPLVDMCEMALPAGVPLGRKLTLKPR
jgi:hypothetical protein